MSITGSADISPEYDISLSFDGNGKVENIFGYLKAPWEIDFTATVEASQSTSEEIEAKIYTKTFIKRYILIIGPIPIPIIITGKIGLNGIVNISTSGKAEASVETKISGVIDERVTYNGTWEHESSTNMPVVESTSSLSVVATIESTVSLIPSIDIDVTGAIQHSTSVKSAVTLSAQGELIQDLELTRQVFPDVLVQPTKFDINFSAVCNTDTQLKAPLADTTSLFSKQFCDYQLPLFSLPTIEMSISADSTCSSFTVYTDDTDGVNNTHEQESSYWFAGENGEVRISPEHIMKWDYELNSETSKIFYSGYGALGPTARRFWSKEIKSEPEHIYFVDDDGDYVEGSTAEEACLAFLELRNQEWEFMEVVGNPQNCYYARGGIPSQDYDVYIRVRRNTTCESVGLIK